MQIAMAFGENTRNISVGVNLDLWNIKMNEAKFKDLLLSLATAWNGADIEMALNCFTLDGIYMQPPGIHIFIGHDQLKIMFSTLIPGDNFVWHAIWFNPETQSGAGEFTFKVNEAHGVAIIELKNEKIHLWREYQWHGCLSWERFISRDSKEFLLTIENFRNDGLLPKSV